MTVLSDSKKKFKTKCPEYRVYQSMKTRCYNNKEAGWSRYGGRGINVCKEWLKDFWAFYDHIGPRPTQKHSIDRINNDGNYEPGNVRWVLPQENVRNSTSVKWLTHNGKTMTVGDWADCLGICPKTLSRRFSLGWSVEKALSTPKQTKKNATFQNKTMTLQEWAKSLGVKLSLIQTRLSRGWTIEETLSFPTGKNGGRWKKN
jgi:hypothetical protein